MTARPTRHPGGRPGRRAEHRRSAGRPRHRHGVRATGRAGLRAHAEAVSRPGDQDQLHRQTELRRVPFAGAARISPASTTWRARSSTSDRHPATPRSPRRSCSRLLKLSPIPGNDEPALAIAKLRRGEIGAVAFVGGKPAPLLRLANTDGFASGADPADPGGRRRLCPEQVQRDGLSGPGPARRAGRYRRGRHRPVRRTGAARIGRISQAGESWSIRCSPSSRPCSRPAIDGNGPRSTCPAKFPAGNGFPPPMTGSSAMPRSSRGQDLRMIFMKFLDERAKGLRRAAIIAGAKGRPVRPVPALADRSGRSEQLIPFAGRVIVS